MRYSILCTMKYGNRSTWKTISRSPITFVVAIGLCVVLAKAAWNIHQKSENSALRLDQARMELAKLKDHQKDLTARIGQLSSAEGIESELRVKYRAVKEGESVAVIVDDGLAAAASTSTTTIPAVSWWRRLLNFVGF